MLTQISRHNLTLDNKVLTLEKLKNLAFIIANMKYANFFKKFDFKTEYFQNFALGLSKVCISRFI